MYSGSGSSHSPFTTSICQLPAQQSIAVARTSYINMSSVAQDKSAQDERKLEGGGVASPAPSQGVHPALYIGLWIAMSSSVILFNKWVLAAAHFDFPLFLTTWHMVFATGMTQILARFTSVLDSRKKVPMDTNTYMKAIVPIGVMFSLSLILGNLAYLYLSVSFIQMLKATNAVATLIATWLFGMAAPNLKVLANVSIIVVGVAIASFGELKFHMIGFIVQVAGVVAEALRLVMVQRILSSPEFKMDPLVSVYYYAPACAVINGVFTIFFESSRLTMTDIYTLGIFTLIANAFIAFLLNVSVVLLIGKTSAVVMTMSGVLKDILLVVASMVIFGDPVSGQQYFGYGIALAGLTYYKLGADKVNALVTDAQLQWNNARQNHPAKVKLVALCSALGVMTIVLLGWWRATPGGTALPIPAQ
ncbi:triose-phosphate transporter family-domain-containing protein [Xylariales sp. PMI_506]|nr:triose-phosphate transporter family-domain-containing protein [Xylariales sp. PMI_506]